MRCSPSSPSTGRGASLALAVALACGGPSAARAQPDPVPGPRPGEVPSWPLRVRVVATGMQQAYGIRQVGRFHHGGPLVSNPEFLLQTQAGRVLDPRRVLVAVGRNLGAPLGNPRQAPGAILSIDVDAAPSGRALVVPASLPPGQTAEGGAVQVYSVQSTAQLNRVRNAGARTADFAGVSGPRYLSMNNAFGRPWVANAPFGGSGPGSESVLDPDGAPLANAPSDSAGGVFAGALSSRTSRPRAVRTGWWSSLLNHQESGQFTPGVIDQGAMGTAFLGSSPDGSGFAVFAVATGSGAVVQVHVQDGVDGLAPAGTVDVGGGDPGLIGMAFQWVPERALYLAEARRDRIVVLTLGDDTRHFIVQRRRELASPWLRGPTDLAPCIPEIANPRFASHTTLAGDSDLYVVNRGDGSVLRMGQDGTVQARAVLRWPEGGEIGGGHLRSIAVSADAQRLWLIADHDVPGAGSESVLIEASGFDGRGALGTALPATSAAPVAAAVTAEEGARLFVTAFTPATGLGARFNAVSCVACHPGPGGASPRAEHFARRIARMDGSSGRIIAAADAPAQAAPRHALAASGVQGEPLPRGTNVVSLRMPLALVATGRLDEIPDAVIEAQAVAKGDGIKGRVHHVTAADGSVQVGRYGWKADRARLDEMVAEALSSEMGITSALAVHPAASVKDDGTLVKALSAFLRAFSGGSPPSPAPETRRATAAEALR